MTAQDPSSLEFPSSATGLRGGSWVLSGRSVLRDGRSLRDDFGPDLDALSEGDRVGVQATAGGELHLWVNGRDYGAAASGLPQKVWAVVDLYGKCTQVTVVEEEGEGEGGSVLPPEEEEEEEEEEDGEETPAAVLEGECGAVGGRNGRCEGVWGGSVGFGDG